MKTVEIEQIAFRIEYYCDCGGRLYWDGIATHIFKLDTAHYPYYHKHSQPENELSPQIS